MVPFPATLIKDCTDMRHTFKNTIMILKRSICKLCLAGRRLDVIIYLTTFSNVIHIMPVIENNLKFYGRNSINS